MGKFGDLINLGVKTVTGVLKHREGKKQLAEAERNKPQPITYTIPSSVQEAVRMYQGLSQEGLPGEDVIRDQMGAAYAGAAGDITRTAESGVGALGAMTGLYGKFMNSVRDLGVQSAKVKAQNEQNYILQNAQAKMQLGDYQDRAWDVNVNQPFQRGMNEDWATKQAGTANLWGGIDDIGSGIVDFNSAQDKRMSDMMGLMTGGMSNLGTKK
jgi:hypothetical protein